MFVIGHYGHMGGAERQAFHLIRYLRERHDASVATLGWFGTEGPLAAALQEIGCGVFSYRYKEVAPKAAKILNLLTLAHFIKVKIAPDFILPFVSINSKPICQIWKLTGARFAWWNQQDEGRRMFGTRAEGRALRNASLITSNSIAGTQFIAKNYGVPEASILTYNNGTPVPDLAQLRPMWRERIGIPKETPLVSMIANITPFKDHTTLFHAWKLVLEQFPRHSPRRPMLALAGFTKNTEFVNQLKVLAFDLGLGDSIRFLGAIESTNELMFESNLVVHSSRTEGCPNAVCEAMALGKPVVGTDIPGMRQALDERLWNRCLAEPGDAEHLAKNISELLTDDNSATRVGATNRDRIQQHFTIDGMCKTLLSRLPGNAE